MTLFQLYQSLHNSPERESKGHALLRQAHWFAINAEFDPRTGEALPQPLSAFLAKVSRTDRSTITYDRLWRITEHARSSVERLMRSLSESPRREHALMPVHAVRELDSNSFIKLSNRPGRNIREKLAGKPYMQAVRRYQSEDLPENRLFKAFVTRLAELLELRRDFLHEEEDGLIARIHSWHRSDQAQSIAPWDNLPPNNTLLSHLDYRRIWDAWRWMQTLDDDISTDLANFESRAETMREWQNHAEAYLAGWQLFADQPILFCYNSYSIRPWSAPILIRETERKVVRLKGITEINEPVCVDLMNLPPCWASASKGYDALPDIYLWQQWDDGKETVDLGLFCSDAAFLHTDATTVALHDLFFGSNLANDLMHRASRSFASRIRENFKNDSLVWLVPDSVNDFEIKILRRNLNSHFSSAEPLPRSVAAIFEQVDYSRIKKEGFTVVVVDCIRGRKCATKLIAKFDQELQKRLPETNGFYWERCPPVSLSDSNQGTIPHADEQIFDLLTLDSKGNWHDLKPVKNPQPISPRDLKEESRIGSYNLLIDLKKSPVAGGARLHLLQLQAGGIPLWRDQMPELAIKGYIGGFYRRFYLVSKGTTIKPLRGKAVQIPISELFTLPAGKRFYQFPLFQGENAAELSFSARLDSPVFPLKSNTECELVLTFQYGEDEPYSLMLDPIDKSFPSISATWQRTEEETVNDARSPVYPKRFSWEDLRKIQKPDSMETSDLLEWVVSAIDSIDRDLVIRPQPRIVGTLTGDWGKDRKGYHIARARCGISNDVFIHERNFAEGFTYLSFGKGSQLSFELQKDHDGRLSGRRIAHSDYTESGGLRQLDKRRVSEIVSNIRKAIYFPMIKIWNDGRSIEDSDCPEEFFIAISERLDFLAELIGDELLPHEIKRELLFLLACTHQDTRKECVEWIADQIESKNLSNPRAVGFALGSLSQPWQRFLFDVLIRDTAYLTVNVCAFAAWRASQFIEQLRIEDITILLNCIFERFTRLQRVDGTFYNSVKAFELLLGLLRTRASEEPEIRMVLQPHQKITKQLAEQIDRIEEMIANSNITLFSRVKIDVPKPEGVCTPDLLYALRLYLTGDDGANAIHITSISDTDEV